MTSDLTPAQSHLPSRRERVASRGPARLGRWARSLLAVCGLLMVAAGGFAVFVRDVEAGPTALITIGAIMVVIGASGLPLQSIRFGDNEIQLSPEAAQEIEEKIERSSPEQALAIFQGAVAADPAVLRDPGIRMAASASFTWLIQDTLKTLFRTVDVSTRNDAFDAVLRPSHRTVGVEARFGGHPDHLQSFDLWKALRRFNSTSDVDALVLVSPKALRPADVERAESMMAERGKTFRFVQWVDGVTSGPELKRVVEELSERAQAVAVPRPTGAQR